MVTATPTRARVRRRGRTGQPRCQVCGAVVVWFKSPFTSGWRTFNPKPVDPAAVGAAAYPVESKRAWRREDLAVELMGRWSTSHTSALEHVDAMPHHTLHACPAPENDTESTAP